MVVQWFKKFWFSCLATIFASNISNLHAQTVPFLPGEWLEYQVYFSLIHAGTATMCVDEQFHKLNEHLCYKIQVKGTSSKGLGFLGFKVLHKWESYLEADMAGTLRPHKSVTDIQENNYIKKGKIDFDYQSNQARVEVAESIHNMAHTVTYHPIPSVKNIKDLISSYYALRAIDTAKLKPGDKLVISVLHDQKLYEDLAILFLGTKTIKTKLGCTSALVFAPLVPTKDSIFAHERPVEAYISNDANKVPLKLKVNLVIGSVEIVLTGYKGLKEPIRFQ